MFGSCVLVIAGMVVMVTVTSFSPSQTWREEVQADQERRLII